LLHPCSSFSCLCPSMHCVIRVDPTWVAKLIPCFQQLIKAS
jgi:hypothetical protein